MIDIGDDPGEVACVYYGKPEKVSFPVIHSVSELGNFTLDYIVNECGATWRVLEELPAKDLDSNAFIMTWGDVH